MCKYFKKRNLLKRLQYELNVEMVNHHHYKYTCKGYNKSKLIHNIKTILKLRKAITRIKKLK